MGYAYYEITRPNGKPMKRGYSVGCKCHKRGCNVEICRGVANLCYDCTWYYCGDHLTDAYCEHDEPIEVECFAGESSQVCEKCARELEIWRKKYPEDCHHDIEPELQKAIESNL